MILCLSWFAWGYWLFGGYWGVFLQSKVMEAMLGFLNCGFVL